MGTLMLRCYTINTVAMVGALLLMPFGCAHTAPSGPLAPPDRVAVVEEAPAPDVPPPVASPAPPSVGTALEAGVVVAVQYGIASSAIALNFGEDVLVSSGAETLPLTAGSWVVSPATRRLPQTRFNVYSKAFLNDEETKLADYLVEMRGQGFDPQVHIFGRQFTGRGGEDIDNRQYWVALGLLDREAAVAPLKARLNEIPIWAWHREEKLDEGEAVVHFTQGDRRVTLAAPARLRVQSASLRFDNEQRSLSVTGELEFALAIQGGLEVVGQLELETYLKGVLPAEMPASWPMEALRAQAVAARSEVLANLAGKHHLEGFDFCTKEHCRVYGGTAAQMAPTDDAVVETRGEVITHEHRAVPTVFSANCGGWTENNDTVWSGPPQAPLRGRVDGGEKVQFAALQSDGDVAKWLGAGARAWCDDGSGNYRWTRDFNQSELSVLVNKSFGVGRVRAIESGSRGVGGRLKSVRIVGDKDTITVEKELPIRRVFGGLHSALFVVSTWKDAGGGLHFRFKGAGRGHGVGLCQSGARGMALNGQPYSVILNHYFTGVELQRLY